MVYLSKYHRPVTEFDSMTIEQKAATIAFIEIDIENEKEAEKKANRQSKKGRKRR